jgi:hypothetical protein
MSAKAPTTDQIISLPKGGGALRGIGEKFAPDLQTGTGNFSVPIELPPGRNGFQPQLALAYSTGNPNSAFGLGWGLTVPGIQRKTSKGVPRYDDARDSFVLSGAEDLVRVPGGPPGTTRYRPRTEGLFARILHHRAEDEPTIEQAQELRRVTVSSGEKLSASPRRASEFFGVIRPVRDDVSRGG